MKKNTIFLVILMLSSILISAGCGKVPYGTDEDSQVIATINDYELTVRDLKNEADFKMADRYFEEDPAKAKRMLLENIIMAKILLQEAEKKSFDKDELFMKEIELYWEQALLKLLVKKRTEEMSRQIAITEDEIKQEYNRMLTEEGEERPFSEAQPEITREIYNKKMQVRFNEWLKSLRNQADVKIDEEKLNKVVITK